MCKDATAGPPAGLTRRKFLHDAAGIAASAVVFQKMPKRLSLASPNRPEALDGSSAYSMAMHIHSSFSEQEGSMDAQLYQAALNSVDVVWWTDHDHRMDGLWRRERRHGVRLTASTTTRAPGAIPPEVSSTKLPSFTPT